MFNKTTSILFQKYGEIFNEFTSKRTHTNRNNVLKITNDSVDFLYQSSEDVYLRVDEGIALLVLTNNMEAEALDIFVIHRVVKINKGVYYNFIAISNSAKIELSSIKGTKTTNHILHSGKFIYEKLKPSVSIKEILAYYYVVRNRNYVFPGEIHQHWELTFIDNGSMNTIINADNYTLNDYDIVLYAPGEFHTQSTSSEHTCSYLTIIFDMECRDETMLMDRIFHANRELHNAIDMFVKASNNNTLYDTDLMATYLQEIIIKLLRSDYIKTNPVANTPMQQKFESELLNEILIYINENIYTPLNIEDLCNEFSISRSSLQTLFKNNLNSTPKQFISNLKLNKSKLLIKESKYTISEISNILGFASIHYFSRKFKQQFGIAPTDYAKTIYN